MNITAELDSLEMTGYGKQTGERVRPSRDEIARRAYQRYIRRGRRDGHDVDDWLNAERELEHHYR